MLLLLLPMLSHAENEFSISLLNQSSSGLGLRLCHISSCQEYQSIESGETINLKGIKFDVETWYEMVQGTTKYKLTIPYLQGFVNAEKTELKTDFIYYSNGRLEAKSSVKYFDIKPVVRCKNIEYCPNN